MNDTPVRIREVYLQLGSEQWQASAHTSGLDPSITSMAVDWCNQYLPLGSHSESIIESALFTFCWKSSRLYRVVGQLASHDSAGQSAALVRMLILRQEDYSDPFMLVERIPPNWHANRELAAPNWSYVPAPQRQIAEIQAILASGDAAFLLGGAQALLDGCKLLVDAERDQTPQIRSLWQLLPEPTQRELTFSTASHPTLPGFDIHCVPKHEKAEQRMIPGYLSMNQARDYPLGRYERALHLAADSNDQDELNRLLARRTSSETMTLAVRLVVIAVVIAIITKFL